MAFAISKEQIAELEAARAGALTERKGLIDPAKDKHLVEAPLRRWGTAVIKGKTVQIIRGINPVTGLPSHTRRAYIASVMENQFRAMAGWALQGSFFDRIRVEQARMFLSGPLLRKLAETTTSGDIATYTQQVLAFIEPIFERITIDQLIHMRTMQGPTAFIHTLDFLQGSTGDLYEGGTTFQGNLDIDYSDCPTECALAREVDLTLTQTTVNAVCKRLQARWCLPAEQDYSSQHGRSISDDVRAFMQLQMMREKQGEVLNELVAGVGFSGTFPSAIPVGSVYNTLDPKAYQATLFDAIIDADNEIFKSTDGYRGSNWIAADPDSLNRLQKLKRFSITQRDRVARTQAGEGDIDEFANFFGVANQQWNTWKYPFMTPNTILLGVKSDAPQELGFIHAEYIALADLGISLDPGKAEIVTGMMSRYANVLIRPGLYASISIT